MLRVAALTSGKDTPSARYRIRQHIRPLKKAGIDVHEYRPRIGKYTPIPFLKGKNRRAPHELIIRVLWTLLKTAVRIEAIPGSWKAQITWLEREMVSGFISLEPLIKRPYIFDVDDAIWLSPPFGKVAAKQIAKGAAVVIAGNAHIAEWFADHAGDVRIIPTAVDTDLLRPLKYNRHKISDAPFRVGWVGTSGNYEFLYKIEEELAHFFSDYKAEFWIVSDQPPKFLYIPADKIKYYQWGPDIESEILPLMDIGLMPLSADEWSLGKCSYKMLQYMAAGLPVVVSPVGMNNEVLSMGDIGFAAGKSGDWYEALETAFKDPPLGLEYGANGRRVILQYFSKDVVSKMLVETFLKFV